MKIIFKIYLFISARALIYFQYHKFKFLEFSNDSLIPSDNL